MHTRTHGHVWHLNNLDWSYQLFNRFILTGQWKNDALSIAPRTGQAGSAISLNIAYIDINRQYLAWFEINCVIVMRMPFSRGCF